MVARDVAWRHSLRRRERLPRVAKSSGGHGYFFTRTATRARVIRSHATSASIGHSGARQVIPKQRLLRATFALTLLGAQLPRPVRAADPRIAECLAASEASLQSGAQHLLRTERNQLLVCSAASCPGDVRRECSRRVEEVNASIPTLIFEARDAAGQDLSAVKVTLDAPRRRRSRTASSRRRADPARRCLRARFPGRAAPPGEPPLR